MFKNLYNIWFLTSDLNFVKSKLNLWFFTNIKYFFLKNNIYIQYFIYNINNLKFNKLIIFKFNFNFGDIYFFIIKILLLILIFFMFV